MTQVYLKRKIAQRIANGHPWIFANEVEKIKGNPQPGETVDVFYADGKYCGRGYINTQSQIMVRLLTRKQETIDNNFFSDARVFTEILGNGEPAQPVCLNLLHALGNDP